MELLTTIKDILYFKEVLHISGILFAAWILMRVSQKLIRVFHQQMKARIDCTEETKRIETLAIFFRHAASVVITLVAGMLVLSVLGISIAPILGAAGVVGIAVGFGAQSLFKDFFSGFFILVENQIRQGDVVEICNKSGLVEEVTLRYIRLRDYEGSVHYVPNGLITTVTSRSRGHAFAVIDVSIAYRESIDEACAVMREVAQQMRTSELFASKILEDIDIAGVEAWSDSAIILRCRFKTAALEQWGVKREFLRRLKDAFDARNIEIPYPHLTVYAGQDKEGNAPNFHLLHSNHIKV